MPPAKTALLVILVVGVLAVAATVGAQPPLPLPADGANVAAGVTPVPAYISYQGRLTDGLGAPLGGHYSMVFQFWTDDTAGVQVGGDVVLADVLVDGGLFTVALAAPADAITGQALWLRIQVNGRWLSPRQPLLPVPYALSVRPGAMVWTDSDTRAAFSGGNDGRAPGIAGYGYGADGVGVTGAGITGVRGTGFLPPVGNNMAGPPTLVGVEGDGMIGVLGNSPSGGSGVKGVGPTGIGVYGSSSSGTGVQATSGSGAGLRASGQVGVDATGVTTGTTSAASAMAGRGVAGFADNYSGVGVYGHSGFGTGVVGDGEMGVKGTSSLGTGVRGDGLTGVYGHSTRGGYGLYTPDNLYVGGHCVGCKLALVARNGGAQAIEPGDVVAVAGMAAPNAAPVDAVVLVRRADEAAGAQAFGVAVGRYVTVVGDEADGRAAAATLTTQSVQPADNLIVVYEGLARVRVTAAAGSIAAGDVVGLGSGRAQAERFQPGAAPPLVRGIALEALAEGDSTIWVLLLRQ